MKESRSRGHADWLNMTLSDLMDVTPSEWLDRSYGDLMRRKPSDWLSSYRDLMRTSPSDWWATIYGSGPGLGTTTPTRAGKGRHHGPGCECHEDRCCRGCAPDSCECYCCIGDVDLAVYSRLGEQRVIPIVVENERRRDKQITLELSAWTTRGGNPAPVDTVLLEPRAFTLSSCGEQKVTLVVKTRGEHGDPNTGQAPQGERVSPDVDNCLVATADLRLVGCDHRPMRVAIAILPRDCDPYTVTCGCTCC